MYIKSQLSQCFPTGLHWSVCLAGICRRGPHHTREFANPCEMDRATSLLTYWLLLGHVDRLLWLGIITRWPHQRFPVRTAPGVLLATCHALKFCLPFCKKRKKKKKWKKLKLLKLTSLLTVRHLTHYFISLDLSLTKHSISVYKRHLYLRLLLIKVWKQFLVCGAVFRMK